jgi:hypothetical protein
MGHRIVSASRECTDRSVPLIQFSELSANNRAGCQDKVCKDSGNKITKGELRLGVWFTMPGTEHGSWKWRHWYDLPALGHGMLLYIPLVLTIVFARGCVSGKTISNIQESIGTDGDYDWDMLDGYDEIPYDQFVVIHP